MCWEKPVIRDRKEELLKFHARHFSEHSKNGRHENSNGHQSELTDEEEEFTVMYRWFDDAGYEADIPTLRSEYPELTTLEQYLRNHGWEGA
jgi:hypothetical protein